MEQVTFLYNVTMLEDPSFPNPSNAQQHYPTPSPNSRVSSRRESIASINPIINALPIENKHRTLSIVVKACPVIDGIKLRYIESRRNCMLDISTLLNLKSYNSLNNIGYASGGLGFNSTKNDIDAGNNGILPRGRFPKLQKQTDLDVCGGVAVSFVGE